MSRDKQIEEIDHIESVLWEANHSKSVLDYRWLAQALYSNGYRKASDIAREIFEEIEQKIAAALKSNYKVLPQVIDSYEIYHTVQGKISALRGINDFIDELKKKYESEGVDDDKV